MNIPFRVGLAAEACHADPYCTRRGCLRITPVPSSMPVKKPIQATFQDGGAVLEHAWFSSIARKMELTRESSLVAARSQPAAVAAPAVEPNATNKNTSDSQQPQEVMANMMEHTSPNISTSFKARGSLEIADTMVLEASVESPTEPPHPISLAAAPRAQPTTTATTTDVCVPQPPHTMAAPRIPAAQVEIPPVEVDAPPHTEVPLQGAAGRPPSWVCPDVVANRNYEDHKLADVVDHLFEKIKLNAVKVVALDDLQQQLLESGLTDTRNGGLGRPVSTTAPEHHKTRCDASVSTTPTAAAQALGLDDSNRAELALYLYTLRHRVQEMQNMLVLHEKKVKQAEKMMKRSRSRPKRIRVQIIRDYEEDPQPYVKAPHRATSTGGGKTVRNHAENGDDESSDEDAYDSDSWIDESEPSSSSRTYTPIESEDHESIVTITSEQVKPSKKDLNRGGEKTSAASPKSSAGKQSFTNAPVPTAASSASSAFVPVCSTSDQFQPSEDGGSSITTASSVAVRDSAQRRRRPSPSTASDASSTTGLFWKRRAAAMEQKRVAALANERRRNASSSVDSRSSFDSRATSRTKSLSSRSSSRKSRSLGGSPHHSSGPESSRSCASGPSRSSSRNSSESIKTDISSHSD